MDLIVRGLRPHLDWMALRGRRPRSIYDRRRALIRLAEALRVDPLDATPDQLAAWRLSLRGSPATIHGYVSHAQRFYSWALDEGLITTDPSRRLVKPRLPRRLPRPMSEPDLCLAVQTAPARVRPWLVLAGWEGLRAQEIANLCREDVLEHADPPLLRVSETGAKGGHARVIPLSSFVLAELRRAGMPRSGPLFPRRDGRSGPTSAGIVSKLCNEHLRAVGVAATLHAARHRTGTQAYRHSQDLRLVASLLGHANIQTTSGYVAYSQASAVRVMEALPLLT